MKLDIDTDVLHIRLNPLEVIFSQLGSLYLPLNRITGASVKKPRSEWGQLRAPDTHIPFLLKAGTYHGGQRKEFYYTTIGMPYLVIGLQNWDFDRIVLTMSDNRAWAERINEKIK